MAVHLLRFEETGRSISFTCPTPQASATWEVHDLTETVSSSSYIADSGSATVDATAITPSAAAGPGQANPRRITTSDTTGATVGRFYQIAEDGRSEIHEIAGVSTNAYVQTKHPLVGTYTTAATISGLTVTAALADTIAATQSYVDYDEPLRIVWTLADGSIHQEQVRVVRQDFGDLDLASILSQIRDLFPQVGKHLEQDGRGTLESMVSTVVGLQRTKILMDGEQPHRVLHGDQGNAIAVWATLEHLAAMNIRPGSDDDATVWMEYCRRQHKHYWGNTKLGRAGARTAAIAPVVETATGNADPKPRRRFTFA